MAKVALFSVIKWTCFRLTKTIVRWSAKNEPQCLEESYHVELYEAIKAIDDSRPISEDIVVADWNAFDVEEVYKGLRHKEDFTWIDHYLSYDERRRPFFSTTQHNDAVIPMSDRPYGLGEADWMRSSTAAGLTWFASTIALARAQGASDVRPYVLLSSWASSIPGVKTADFLTEEGRHPVYGEDNLPDPWTHPGICLLQKACNPMLAMDREFWQVNKEGNCAGCFPVTALPVEAGSQVTREVTVFNDEFRGDHVELYWDVREGSASNQVLAQGKVPLSIPPGLARKVTVTFDAPDSGGFLFLTLKVRKDGVERFNDSLTCFEVIEGADRGSPASGETGGS